MGGVGVCLNHPDWNSFEILTFTLILYCEDIYD